MRVGVSVGVGVGVALTGELVALTGVLEGVSVLLEVGVLEAEATVEADTVKTMPARTSEPSEVKRRVTELEEVSSEKLLEPL